MVGVCGWVTNQRGVPVQSNKQQTPLVKSSVDANCLAMSHLECWTEDPGSPGSVSLYTIDAATGALTLIGAIGT